MKFVAYAREQQGTGASRRLRVSGKVPGIVYGAGEPAMIELDHNALFHALKKEAFHSSLLDMELAGQTQQVLLRDVQMHAYKPLVLHVDFQRVDATTRIVKKVPLHFINEENAPGVKTDKGVMSHVATELEIECLASQLPEFLTVDLGELGKGQSIHVADLKLPKGVKPVLRGKKNPVLATVVNQAEEEVQPETPVATPAAKAAPAKGKKDEKQNRK
ncbi:MAG TPA: 50S ribosomal protein L25/general stress protein Ctc [Methylibium sp.]|uniref:50S ribosomal protein L25/general stress protein Ctc n=1 Tax=Methylibium sp. TaxID=2067992 RepID=UPI002DB89136|nr:50S ribosomal protein L25/general stress protein Ctc [Methylibium sp.]HEU4457912.1 50S ribosomal protein L25/general stress protein Ctc [Methylibium sp.]